MFPRVICQDFCSLWCLLLVCFIILTHPVTLQTQTHLFWHLHRNNLVDVLNKLERHTYTFMHVSSFRFMLLRVSLYITTLNMAFYSFIFKKPIIKCNSALLCCQVYLLLLYSH